MIPTRLGAPALAAGALLLALTAGARADGVAGLPEGTAVVLSGLPPYAPAAPRSRESDRRWREAAEAAGRERRGTRLGADLLYASAAVAAAAVAATGDDGRAEAALLYEEAAASYDAADPTGAVVAARAARLRLDAKDAEGARPDVERLERWRASARRTAPPDLEAPEAARWEGMRRAVAVDLPRLRADLALADGRLADAADEGERFASHPEDLALAVPPLDAGDVWFRAADLRRRVGQRDRASEDALRSLEATQDERLRAERAFWRVFLEHDALADDGTIRPPVPWPGDAFLEDVRAAARGLAGNPHVAAYLLTLASGALAAGRVDIATDLYLRAADDPAFVEAARANPTLARALLPAAEAAARAGRFDEARRLLEHVDLLRVLPREEVDRGRVRLAEAVRDRRAADEAEALAAREAGERPSAANSAGASPPPPAAPPSGRGGLGARPRAPDDGPSSPPPGLPPPDPEEGDGGGLLLGGALAAALLALLFLLRRAVGSRRRPR